MDQQAWTECHVEAFAFLQWMAGPAGATDNLATGVERADLYDPQINRRRGAAVQ